MKKEKKGISSDERRTMMKKGDIKAELDYYTGNNDICGDRANVEGSDDEEDEFAWIDFCNPD